VAIEAEAQENYKLEYAKQLKPLVMKKLSSTVLKKRISTMQILRLLIIKKKTHTVPIDISMKNKRIRLLKRMLNMLHLRQVMRVSTDKGMKVRMKNMSKLVMTWPVNKVFRPRKPLLERCH
jgi:hypothetical protein